MDAVKILRSLYRGETWPPPFHVLQGLELVRNGAEPTSVARQLGTTARRLIELADEKEPTAAIPGVSAGEATEEDRTAARRNLAQLLLGRAAELGFEDIYPTELGAQEFELVDLREGRTDTDYRLLNGRKRPIYRINIKFTGSTFRRAQELVGLDPEDCFPLATYKIFNAINKQLQEHLPYIFLAVFARSLNINPIGSYIPTVYIEFMSLLRRARRGGLRRRNLEDRIIDQNG